MNEQFKAAYRYAKLIPKMKERNKLCAKLRLLEKIKAAISV